LPKMKWRKRCVPWWTPDLSKLRKLATRYRRRYRNAKSASLRDLHLTAWLEKKKQYEAAILEAKNISWKNFLSSQRKETVWGQIFRLLRTTQKRPVPTTIRKPCGEITSGAQSTATVLLNAFVPNDDIALDDARHHA